MTTDRIVELGIALDMAREERDRAKKRTADLEALVMDLRVKNQQLETRLRIADMMEQEAHRRAVTVDEFSILAGEQPREIIQ